MGMVGLVSHVIAFTVPPMSQTAGCGSFSPRLQHYASVATRSLGRLPGWSIGLVLLHSSASRPGMEGRRMLQLRRPHSDLRPNRRIPAAIEGGGHSDFPRSS